MISYLFYSSNFNKREFLDTFLGTDPKSIHMFDLPESSPKTWSAEVLLKLKNYPPPPLLFLLVRCNVIQYMTKITQT